MPDKPQPNILQTTPFMHIPLEDFESAVAFFRDLLGFTLYVHARDYAYLHRDNAGIRIWGRRPDDHEAPPRGIRNFRYYYDVKDIEALYAELKPKLDQLPPGDVHGPADKHYGQRELCILAPDGDLVVFGQEIFPSPALVSPPTE